MEPQDKATKSPGEKPSFWEKPFTKSYLEGMGQIMGKVTVWAFIVVVPIILWNLDIIGPGPGPGPWWWKLLAGGGTAAVLAVATETPVAVAVVVGFLVWWVLNSLF